MGRHRHVHEPEETDPRTDVSYFVFFPAVDQHLVCCAQEPCEATFAFDQGPPVGWVWREAAGFVSYECSTHAPTCVHDEPHGEYWP